MPKFEYPAPNATTGLFAALKEWEARRRRLETTPLSRGLAYETIAQEEWDAQLSALTTPAHTPHELGLKLLAFLDAREPALDPHPDWRLIRAQFGKDIELVLSPPDLEIAMAKREAFDSALTSLHEALHDTSDTSGEKLDDALSRVTTTPAVSPEDITSKLKIFLEMRAGDMDPGQLSDLLYIIEDIETIADWTILDHSYCESTEAAFRQVQRHRKANGWRQYEHEEPNALTPPKVRPGALATDIGPIWIPAMRQPRLHFQVAADGKIVNVAWRNPHDGADDWMTADDRKRCKQAEIDYMAGLYWGSDQRLDWLVEVSTESKKPLDIIDAYTRAWFSETNPAAWTQSLQDRLARRQPSEAVGDAA